MIIEQINNIKRCYFFIIFGYRMRGAIEKGLGKSSHPTSTVKCFPTYVKELPSGCESGKYLALDLGGTNFRVVVIDIGENK